MTSNGFFFPFLSVFKQLPRPLIKILLSLALTLPLWPSSPSLAHPSRSLPLWPSSPFLALTSLPRHLHSLISLTISISISIPSSASSPSPLTQTSPSISKHADPSLLISKKPISVIRRRPIPLKKTGALFRSSSPKPAPVVFFSITQPSPSPTISRKTHLCYTPALISLAHPCPRLPLLLSPHLHHAALTISEKTHLCSTRRRSISPFSRHLLQSQHEIAALHQEKSLFFSFSFSFCQNPSHHLSRRWTLATAQISSRASSVAHQTIRTALFSLDWQRTRNALIYSSFSEHLSPRLVPLFFLSLYPRRGSKLANQFQQTKDTMLQRFSAILMLLLKSLGLSLCCINTSSVNGKVIYARPMGIRSGPCHSYLY
ncbi:hypothetical protein CKAN_00167100 [Cinnamomum micranthum f. kanehirae]|uniref:Uncharacterized protein n=1 Tax=Cinnamomum micranthum f. kanehirae TaxID=337451 RepID=A0A3S3LXQ4_9MAGN|nr:hypothetical protein CKAN_00167100 [Cinnamomum micranthum f. kanehirae]